MHRRLFLFSGLCGLYLCGCGGSSETGRHALQGTVSVEGNAVAKGSISFLPSQGVAGSPASTAIEEGEYRFTDENGPFAGEHRVVIGVETEQSTAVAAPSGAVPAGVSSGIKVAPPPDDSRPPGQARRPATASPKTQWELQYKIEENGDDRKDFDLSG
jgi:hypothetical protein